MEDKFLTIISASQGLYKDKGSRFIAYAYPISSEDEVKSILDVLEKEHHAARHCCYAYRLFGGQWRCCDDGEPSGTAGRPIIGQIDSASLTNVLVVVVRYFGGILLGVPGLIRAYKSAAADALENAQKVQKTATALRSISFPYDRQPSVEKFIKDYGLSVKSRNFSDKCYMQIEIPLRLVSECDNHIKKLANLEN